MKKRTHECGALRSTHVDTSVTLDGWVHRRRDHGGVIFIDLRDRSGLVQLVFNPDYTNESVMQAAHRLRSEYVIQVEGTVLFRAHNAHNPALATGQVEVGVQDLTIHNAAHPLPFQLEEASEVDEELRLKYRYLDLRRPEMHRIFKTRHEVIFALRKALDEEGFYEIETPLLSKSTPEGARDFIVPSRLQQGSFYALPQSPQIYKQLLMASGMERYFQIARCFRDEDLRANRQPEFTQLDVEMSFVDEADIMQLMERVLGRMFKEVCNIHIPSSFPHHTYHEVFDAYGTDKPDLRYDLSITHLTEFFKDTQLSFVKAVIEKEGSVGALCVKNHEFTRSELEKWVSYAISHAGAKGLLYIRFKEDGSVDSPVAKFLPTDTFTRLQSYLPELHVTDTLFLVAGPYKQAWTSLGRLRTALAQDLSLYDKTALCFAWITDFPLLEWDEETKRYYATHHPFTRPEDNFDQKEPGDIKARAYDLVCNGEEVGGGSLRIHDAATQEKIFSLLGITPEHMKEAFGFLLEAQKLGFPVHGGIALGIDRLIMTIVGTDSIRDVIAFPKTQSGHCPLMDTPCVVDSDQLKEVAIQLHPSLRLKKEQHHS